MQYTEAVQTVLNKDSLTGFLLVLIALMVLFLLVVQVAKAVKEVFVKPRTDDDQDYAKHCRDSEERFKRGERHIAENRDDIRDLKDGMRVSCLANMALLNHAIHNGNTAEMESASAELNKYLINRK
jgi:flagellar biosynthesis/type III secretory pathway M-ring protein FliF/YscJ